MAAFENSKEVAPPVKGRAPIVGIGASAGGIKALMEFFEEVPEDAGAAFVVIVHLAPDFRSELAQVLRAHSKLTVTQITDKAELKANCIYVIPPDRQLDLSDREISAVPFAEPRGQRAPIDVFFRSLAAQDGDGIAVILSGAGSDGAAGVTAVKEQGGVVLVQLPEEAQYPSMPRSAITTGAADVVLPVRQLAARVVELIGSRQQRKALAERAGDDDRVRRILSILRGRTGHDFSLYKRTTVLRRIGRRLQVTRRDSLEDYAQYLRETPDEAQALLADLLISVTTFFRDPPAFESLARNAIVPLLRNVPQSHGPLRVWVAGCATGEEAYSIAMLLLEEATQRATHPDIQIFASDMDARALAIAREGRYPVAIEADLSDERLRRFFVRDGNFYTVRRELRDAVLFASHSILKDPPFSRVDLISCRNLLIYLDRELQDQILGTLHYALNPGGYLFLGSSETADQPQGLFRAVDREARLFQAIAPHGTERMTVLPRLSGPTSLPALPSVGVLQPRPTGRIAQSAHREALEMLAPPSILVDRAYRVVHLSETAGRYLEPSDGPLTLDVTDLARPELRLELRAALHRAFEQGEKTLSGAIPVQFNGKKVRVYMHVKPMLHDEGPTAQALVMFIEGETHEPLYESGVSNQAQNEAAHRLRQELELAYQRMRTMREEAEAANEELRATNEELQSINEEYRSTAEELETGKEELQSINEELQTVNAELKIKLDIVSRANSDLQNFMAATDIATLFLDPDFKIKRFTPRLAELFSITAADVGRPIADFTHRLEYDGLLEDAAKVVQELVPLEREVQSQDGRLFLVRVRPYRTADSRIEGVVVTFVDMTERRRMEGALAESAQRLRAEMRLVDLSRTPLFVWDFDTGEILQWNRGCAIAYGYSKQEAVGQKAEELLKTAAPNAAFVAVRSALERDGVWSGPLLLAPKGGAAATVESTLELFAVDGRRYVLESGRRYPTV